jgi:hypothetical protein
MIEEHWLPNVDWDNDRIPCGLCHHCRQQLIQISDGIIDSPTLLYEFSDIVLPVLTSDRPNCTCQICLIIHPGGLNNEKQFPHDLPRKNGRPRKDDSEPEISFIGTPPPPELKCPRCGSVLDQSTLNIMKEVNKDCRVGEKVVSNFLKRKKTASPGGRKHLSQALGGRKLPVTLGKVNKTADRPMMPHAVAFKVANNLGLSNTKSRDLITIMNQASGSKVFAPNLQKSLTKHCHELKDFFTVSTPEILDQEHKVVHVIDLASFIQAVLERRNLERTDVHVRLSLDFGGKFLKLTLSLMEIWPQTARVKKGRKSLMENSFKDSGVHKTFLVAIAEAMPEKYETL